MVVEWTLVLFVSCSGAFVGVCFVVLCLTVVKLSRQEVLSCLTSSFPEELQGLVIVYFSCNKLCGLQWGQHNMPLPPAIGDLDTYFLDSGCATYSQGAPWSRKVMEKSWKMMIMSWNIYYCTEQFCKSDTTSFIKSNYEPFYLFNNGTTSRWNCHY